MDASATENPDRTAQLRDHYDVIIIGAGPAGIFAALELTRTSDLSILILEKGQPIAKRRCPARQTSCIGCATCAIMTGWGGAGAFSDGKLTLSTDVGGWLAEYVGEGTLAELIDYADRIWIEFGATTETHGPDPETAYRLIGEAAAAGMRLIPMRIRHLGTDRSPQVLQAMQDHLASLGVDISTSAAVDRILTADGTVVGVRLQDGVEIATDAIVAAPGREGADWLAAQAGLLGLGLVSNAVDIGVRVELPAKVMEPLTDELYEAKLIFTSESFGDTVRTFCMNPHGEVTVESYGDVVTVNGHSYADSKTENTNFAVLVSQRFTEPFHEPIPYGASVARLANLLGEGILVQRLGDLEAGRRSTPERIDAGGMRPSLPATPGDLSFVLPYRHLTDILEFLHAMDRLAPGVASPDTLLYGVEVKFYSSRLKLGADLSTSIAGLFGVGDGAGVTRGLIQASASGIVAARGVVARLR